MLTRSDYSPPGDINIAQRYCAGLGFDTLPLKPHSKIPIYRNWQERAPSTMWKLVPDNVNVGIRCGGPRKLIVVDCDEKNTPRTYDNVVNILEEN